jgi:predicted RNA-binding protein with PUA domain
LRGSLDNEEFEELKVNDNQQLLVEVLDAKIEQDEGKIVLANNGIEEEGKDDGLVLNPQEKGAKEGRQMLLSKGPKLDNFDEIVSFNTIYNIVSCL